MDRDSNPTVETEAPDSASGSEALTPAEQRRLLVLRDQVNKWVRENDRRIDDIANKLFSGLTDGQPISALDPQATASAAYETMRAMCGETLRISRSLLWRAVRVGAINTHYASGGWHQLGWGMKIELLPLLGSDVDFRRLDRGIEVAVQPEATTRTVRQWVLEHLPEESKNPGGRPKMLSAAMTTRLFEAGRRLRKVTDRRAVAERLRKLDPPALKSAIADLQATIKHLTQLHEELMSE